MKKKSGKTLLFILVLAMISVSVAGCYFANAGSDLEPQIEPQGDEMIDPIDADEGEEPLALSPELITEDNMQLSAEPELQIKQDYLNQFDDGMHRVVDDVTIHSYYGTYNGSVVLIISYNDDYPQIPSSETVADFVFGYANPGRVISVWKAGAFYNLTQAYERSFLTQENVETVHNLYNK